MVVIKAKLSPAPLLTLAAPQYKEILNSGNDVLKLKVVLLTGSPVTSSEENLKLKTIIKVSLFGEHLRSWSSQLDFTVRGSHQFRILSRSVSKLKMIFYYIKKKTFLIKKWKDFKISWTTLKIFKSSMRSVPDIGKISSTIIFHIFHLK